MAGVSSFAFPADFATLKSGDMVTSEGKPDESLNDPMAYSLHWICHERQGTRILSAYQSRMDSQVPTRLAASRVRGSPCLTF
jgi:hypothetical protein